MTVEQYTAFLDLIPDIEGQLKKKGITVPRPRFDKAVKDEEDADVVEVDDDADADEEEEVKEEEAPKRKSKLDKFKLKKNHEATSDEDE